MSVLGKIREKSTLLLIIIGGALVAFVLGDVLSSGDRFFSGRRNEVGRVAGQTISAQEFEVRVQKMEENYKMNTGMTSIDEQTREMLRQQAWTQMLNEIIMDQEYRDIGITVTSQELYDMVAGNDPHPSVRQAFTDPQSGIFDKNRVLGFLKTMDEDPTGDAKKRWLEFEKGIKQEKLNEKYQNLIKKGLYVPQKFAQHEYKSKQRNASIQYIAKRYSEIPDEEITVTEGDLKRYHSDNERKYKQEESRKIEFVVFDVMPSSADVQKASESLEKIRDEFAMANDDSVFVKSYSDAGLQFQYFTKEQLTSDLEQLYSAELGTVIGPFKESNNFRLAKLIEAKMAPDSVKARHILINIADGDTATAMAKADSLKRQIKSGKKFAELAEKNSEDFGSATKGGDLGWFTEGTMVKPFNDAAFQGKKGEMPIVVSQFGVHLIELQEKSVETKRILLAFIDRFIEPSTITFNEVYAQASDFSSRNRTLEDFDKAAADNGYNKRLADNVKPGDRMLSGLEQSRELVRWAYKEEEGSVSKPFEFDNKFVVASLREIREEGIAPLSQVKEQVERAVIREKKADRFMNDFNTALSANSIEEIGSKVNARVEAAENVNFSAVSIPGIGREPVLVGSVFGKEKGKISQPLKGETGVFVILVSEIREPQEINDFSFYKNQISSNLSGRVGFEVFEALKENANVTDNRYRFY
jgi:peptidyl-prolyl cis-trans isomerase D